MIDIPKVIHRLSKRRPVFCSEADFQLEFAWEIKTLYGNKYEVRLEYPQTDDSGNNNRKMHIDILLIDSETRKWIPIELKYKTKGCTITVKDPKDASNKEEETFFLANQGAKDIGCYDYLYDIQRIERLRDLKKEQFEAGYAIILTNEMSYTNKPGREGCFYKEFSIHDDAVKHGDLKWDKNTGSGTKRGREEGIHLDGTYTINWEEYSHPDKNDSNKVFKYAVCKVLP